MTCTCKLIRVNSNSEKYILYLINKTQVQSRVHRLYLHCKYKSIVPVGYFFLCWSVSVETFHSLRRFIHRNKRKHKQEYRNHVIQASVPIQSKEIFILGRPKCQKDSNYNSGNPGIGNFPEKSSTSFRISFIFNWYFSFCASSSLYSFRVALGFMFLWISNVNSMPW